LFFGKKHKVYNSKINEFKKTFIKNLIKKFFFVKVFNNWKKRFSKIKTLFLAGKKFIFL